MNQENTPKIKTRNSYGWVVGISALFVLILVFTSYFSRGALLSRANKVIEMKQTEIHAFLRSSPALTQGIIRRAKRNQALSTEEIMRLDNEWIKEPAKSKLLTRLLSDELSLTLNRFRKDHPAFQEIFITDDRGLVVALTNATSDYYQADEAWWNRAFKEGDYVGDIEYDESAQSTSYGIFHQMKGDHGEVIGVLKGVLDAYEVRVLGDSQKEKVNR